MVGPQTALTLPADVVISPVEQLSHDVRLRLDARPGSCAVTRLRSRVPTKILDATGVDLLREFSRPRRIVEAVLSYSLARFLDPEATLRAAFPMLVDLLASELLVEPETTAALTVTASLTAGDPWEDHRIVRCARLLSDTEVYEVETRAGGRRALKLGRSGADQAVRAALAREAAILRLLGGSIGPRIQAHGNWQGRPYLLTEWMAGTDAETAALHCREGGSDSGLLALCGRILEAYSALHGRGVIHGDVHPSNLVVGPDGSITILDFGCSAIRRGRRDARPPRAGVTEYFEPEYAGAVLQGRTPPGASFRSDQYAVGAMLFRFLTGESYLQFSLDERRALEQIVRDPPTAFAMHGVVRWPAVERVLRRALAKSPSRRFESLATFTQAFARVRPSLDPPAHRAGRTASRQFLSLLLRRLGHAGPILETAARTAPVASLYHGMAGTSAGLLRIACLREDPQLFAQSELWAERVARAAGRRDAFLSARLDMTAAVIGRISVYHARPGLHYLGGLLADARGDLVARDQALARLLRVAWQGSREIELSMGRAGLLLFLGFALELQGERDPRLRGRLLASGSRLHRALCSRLKSLGSIGRSRSRANLGIAHGKAGVLYSLLKWESVAGPGRSQGVGAWLHQLARRATVDDSGARWPWFALGARGHGPASYMPGWCNGSAGMVPLWTLANRLTGDEAFLRMAELAALDAWQNDPGETHLCCGLAGIAYALVNFYRHTGERIWLERAKELAERAAGRALDAGRAGPGEFAHSLFRGDLGLGVLIADLERPDTAAFPLFDGGR